MHRNTQLDELSVAQTGGQKNPQPEEKCRWPDFNELIALPRIAPCARPGSITFMAHPGVSEVVSKSPGLMEAAAASA
jgi:hypothetical protein